MPPSDDPRIARITQALLHKGLNSAATRLDELDSDSLAPINPDPISLDYDQSKTTIIPERQPTIQDPEPVFDPISAPNPRHYNVSGVKPGTNSFHFKDTINNLTQRPILYVLAAIGTVTLTAACAHFFSSTAPASPTSPRTSFQKQSQKRLNVVHTRIEDLTKDQLETKLRFDLDKGRITPTKASNLIKNWGYAKVTSSKIQGHTSLTENLTTIKEHLASTKTPFGATQQFAYALDFLNWTIPLDSGNYVVIERQLGWHLHPIKKDKRFHKGGDYPAKIGTEVKALCDSIVRTDVVSGYGNQVRGFCLDGSAIYSASHLDEFAQIFDEGFDTFGKYEKADNHKQTFVKSSEVIGYVGETGNVTGPHLHYQLWLNPDLSNVLNDIVTNIQKYPEDRSRRQRRKKHWLSQKTPRKKIFGDLEYHLVNPEPIFAVDTNEIDTSVYTAILNQNSTNQPNINKQNVTDPNDAYALKDFDSGRPE